MTETIYKCPKCNGSGLYQNGGMMSIKCDYCAGTGRISKDQYESYMGIVSIKANDDKEEKVDVKIPSSDISNNAASSNTRKVGYSKKSK